MREKRRVAEEAIFLFGGIGAFTVRVGNSNYQGRRN